MKKFRKLVSIDKVALTETGIRELQNYAESIELAQDIPENDEEIVQRIGDADAVLLSANSRLEADVMTQAPNLRYVGMCCSLYSEESANVDIPYARAHGIEVKGIRDYGDHGVVEYVIYQLVKLLHGYEGRMWKSAPMEITGLKVGFVGLGTSGGMTADALQFLGADISYFARAEKPERTAQGFHFKDLKTLLSESDVIITSIRTSSCFMRKSSRHSVRGRSCSTLRSDRRPIWSRSGSGSRIRRTSSAVTRRARSARSRMRSWRTRTCTV